MAYNRVNWEDGEKIADGYVTINGQNYPTVEPVYQGQTATSADNLNVMDEAIKNLDEYLEETSTISNTQETLVGYWVDSSGVKHERYQKELRFSVNSINPGNEFQLNISNVDKFLKIETYYEVDGGFVPLPFSSNVSNPGQTLSARILKDPERVGLFGNLSYGGAGTFIIRVEYTKTSESE